MRSVDHLLFLRTGGLDGRDEVYNGLVDSLRDSVEIQTLWQRGNASNDWSTTLVDSLWDIVRIMANLRLPGGNLRPKELCYLGKGDFVETTRDRSLEPLVVVGVIFRVGVLRVLELITFLGEGQVLLLGMHSHSRVLRIIWGGGVLLVRLFEHDCIRLVSASNCDLGAGHLWGLAGLL